VRDARDDAGGGATREDGDWFHADPAVGLYRAIIHRAILDAVGICSTAGAKHREGASRRRENIQADAIDYLRHDSIEHDAVLAGMEVSTIWALYRGCGEILRENHTTPQRVGAILRRVMARMP